MQPYVIIKTPSCIKVKLKTHPTLISRANKVYKLRVMTTKTHRSIGSLIIKF